MDVVNIGMYVHKSLLTGFLLSHHPYLGCTLGLKPMMPVAAKGHIQSRHRH